MNLATIKSVTVNDAEVKKLTKSPESIAPYKNLANVGYAPALKIAPIAYGYSPISLREVHDKMMAIGNEPVGKNGQFRGYDGFMPHELIADPSTRDNDGYVDRTEVPIPMEQGGGVNRIERRTFYYKYGDLKSELLASVVRNNPVDGLDYVIGIKTERLDAYKALVPPENAEAIAKALETGLFEYVEIWSPYQATVGEYKEFQKENSLVQVVEYSTFVSADELKREAEERKRKLLEDPVAVGYVITNKNDCAMCRRTKITSEEMYRSGDQGHTCNRIPYFIDAWDEDIVLGADMQWLLAG